MALRLYLPSVLAAALSLHASGEVLISQYYEGASFNKWIELSNTDAVAISLDGFVLTRWANAATEEWKQDGASPRYQDDLEGLSIPANGYLLLGNTGAALPAYATADVATNATPNFNGNDSVVLYDTSKGAIGSHAAIADPVSFTDSGNEGANKSFY
ncbi:MAG: lamin tail domain-containing protein, partial [Roseibacillus sp.]|nr:lamin tail domain-containing protein [Roseibacillus sp.]